HHKAARPPPLCLLLFLCTQRLARALRLPLPIIPGIPLLLRLRPAPPTTYRAPPPRFPASFDPAATREGPLRDQAAMGKYMRKGKVSGEVAVMEVPGGALLGVRTRSRTLALQRAQRPPLDKAEAAEEAAGDYLELRSRRLEKPHKEQQQPPSPAQKRGAGRKAVAAAGPGALAEDDVEASFGENVLDFDAMERSTRETTPCSLIRSSDMISTPGSTTKSKTSNSMTSHRRMEAPICRFIPSSLEMEEFFAEAEQQAQHTFREKYNFCPVNDCPLPGRYEWARLDC
ncbi:unnamed protein product, partial [Urochloa humidicola]